MVAKFSPAISSGLPFLSTQEWLPSEVLVLWGQSEPSRFGLSDHVAVVGDPTLILPSETRTPTSPLDPSVVVWAMYTFPVLESTTWFPEMPSLPVMQSSTARPAQSLDGAELITGSKMVPLVDTVSTSALLPVEAEPATTSKSW